MKNEIFGSFFLNASEFAISVESVQEVVNSPERYTSIPLAPKFLKGLFNLRGSIIPVIDLKALLCLPGPEVTEAQKIAIVECQGVAIGLAFEKTGEIFRSQEDERSDFQSETDLVISGVFKKDSGRRLIQILNIQALLKLPNVPHQEGGQKRSRSLESAHKRGTRKQAISFQVGPAKCAMGIESIQEILKVDKITESALQGEKCMGMIDLRGITIPIIDFAAFLKYREIDRTPGAIGGDRRIVVVRIEKEYFGLMVDAVDSIVSCFPDELIAFPVMSKDRAEMFLGCIARSGQDEILLLNHGKIFSDSEISEITHNHNKIYQLKAGQAQSEKQKSGARKTYITFVVEDKFAIGIEDVREIMEYPDSLMHPPGLPAHFRGVLNLRGELVTIVDARAMYSRTARNKEGSCKVLIFKNSGLHFGLVVDAVDSIISFSENEKIKLPELLYQGSAGQFKDDVLEAVQITTHLGEKQSMMILSAQAIAGRVSKTPSAAA